MSPPQINYLRKSFRGMNKQKVSAKEKNNENSETQFLTLRRVFTPVGTSLVICFYQRVPFLLLAIPREQKAHIL